MGKPEKEGALLVHVRTVAFFVEQKFMITRNKSIAQGERARDSKKREQNIFNTRERNENVTASSSRS